MDVDDDETRNMPSSPKSLPHELIVSEILVRLPVKSLLRFKCACKAWRATLSGDASFSQAQLRLLRRQNIKPSSLLIAPYIKNRHGDSTTPGLYLWEENQRRQDGAVVTRVHDMAGFPEEDWTKMRHGFAHCDGLVMLPAPDGTVRVLNPATRRSLTLPWSPNSTTARRRFEGENAFGFGRDPSSGAYKVARFYHRVPTISMVTYSLGMEVFIVGEDDCWRETTANPPYPFMEGRTATFFKGFLIWTVDLESRMYQDMQAAEVSPIVRFSLQDESFSVLPMPQRYPVSEFKDFRLAELHGELAMTRLNKESVEIWTCNDVDGANPPRWVRRHVLKFSYCIRLVAAFDDGIVFQDKIDRLCCQTSEGSKHMVSMKTLKYRDPDTDMLVECSSTTFDGFDVIPYIPTLVPI